MFAVLGLLLSRRFFLMQTDIEEIVNYGADYLFICTVFSFGIFGQIAFERLLQSTGKTLFTMFTQGTGAIINIIKMCIRDRRRPGPLCRFPPSPRRRAGTGRSWFRCSPGRTPAAVSYTHLDVYKSQTALYLFSYMLPSNSSGAFFQYFFLQV